MTEQGDRTPIIDKLRASVRSKDIQELKQRTFYEPGEDVACTLSARLIVEEARRLGSDGSVYEMQTFPDDESAAHAYVVLAGMAENDYPVNCPIEIGVIPPKVAVLTEKGKDITDEIMNSPLEELF